MSDTTDHTPDETTDAPTDAPAESGYDWGDLATESYAQKWAHPGEIARSYTEAQSELDRLRQQVQQYQSQPEPDEPEADPWSAFPPTVDAGTDQQLVNWMQKDPAAAAQWAANNEQLIGAERADYAFAYWNSVNPRAATRWLNEQAFAEARPQFEQALQERTALAQQQTYAAINQAALSEAANLVPDLGDYSDRVSEYIDSPDGNTWFFSNLPQDAAKLKDTLAYRIVQVRDMLWAADQRAAATNPAGAAANDRTRTTTNTRSTAAPAADDDAEVARIKQSLASTRLR